jgi:hypothetical protein
MTIRPSSFSFSDMVGVVPMRKSPVGLLPAKAPASSFKATDLSEANRSSISRWKGILTMKGLSSPHGVGSGFVDQGAPFSRRHTTFFSMRPVRLRPDDDLLAFLNGLIMPHQSAKSMRDTPDLPSPCEPRSA